MPHLQELGYKHVGRGAAAGHLVAVLGMSFLGAATVAMVSAPARQE